jgi:hypothetical protein
MVSFQLTTLSYSGRRISLVRSQIEDLRVKLKFAQQERIKTHDRNTKAREILAHSSRASSEQVISKLKADITNLESELSSYGEKWRKRKETFDEAVGVLEGLEDEIREEKEIKARRLVGVEEEEHDHEHEGDEGPQEPEAEEEEHAEGDLHAEGEEGERKSHHLDPKAAEFVPSHLGSSRPPSHPPTPNPGGNTQQLSALGSQHEEMDVDEPERDEGEGEVHEAEDIDELDLINELSDGEEEDDPRRTNQTGTREEGEESEEEGEMS